MIGKGAQHLTAAGFGRYRITAASLGSLDLLGTFSWLTAATKQAIRAAFGVDGTAVIAATNEYLNGIAASDRAKATALAGFINEDPMMVCSLGLEPQGVTMPHRYLVGDGTAYINTEIVPVTDMYVSMDYSPKNNAEYSIFGVRSAQNGVFFCLQRITGKIRTANNSYWTMTNYVVDIDGNYNIGRINNDVYAAGSKIYTGSALAAMPTNAMYLFTMNSYGSAEQHSGELGLDMVQIGSIANFVTCKHNGENGMYDIERMRWFGNANTSGSFTIPDISYTPTP